MSVAYQKIPNSSNPPFPLFSVFTQFCYRYFQVFGGLLLLLANVSFFFSNDVARSGVAGQVGVAARRDEQKAGGRRRRLGARRSRLALQPARIGRALRAGAARLRPGDAVRRRPLRPVVQNHGRHRSPPQRQRRLRRSMRQVNLG